MQFHYVVYYDTETRKWRVEDEVETYFHDGNAYDSNEDYGWFWPEYSDGEAPDIDQRCYTMLNTLASIWPEVDHEAS